MSRIRRYLRWHRAYRYARKGRFAARLSCWQQLKMFWEI